jgi:hypothetical protein
MNQKTIFTPAFFVVVVVLLASALGFGRLIEAYGIHLKKEAIYPPGGRLISSLPVETESWIQIGADQLMSSEMLEELGTENTVSRKYIQKESAMAPGQKSPHVIDFHAAYYSGMIDTVPHVPERCFVGGGMRKSSVSEVLALPISTGEWVEDGSVPNEFRGPTGAVYTAPTSWQYSDRRGFRVRMPRGTGPSNPVKMRVSEFLGQQNDLAVYAGYFFVANGGTVATAEGVRSLAFDLTSDYAYYLKVQTTCASVGSKSEHAEVSASLIGELLPEIMRCVPDWIEVETGEYPADNPRRVDAAGSGAAAGDAG